MKRYSIIFLLLLCISCNGRMAIKQTLKDFQAAVIELPSGMVTVEDGEMSFTEIQQGRLTFVEYYGPDVCTGCAVSHINDNEKLFELGQELGFDVVIILSPTADELEIICDKLKELHFCHPVFIDPDQSFSTVDIPEDRRFHSFLMDEAGHPVVVGNPANSEKIESVLRLYISSHD